MTDQIPNPDGSSEQRQRFDAAPPDDHRPGQDLHGHDGDLQGDDGDRASTRSPRR